MLVTKQLMPSPTFFIEVSTGISYLIMRLQNVELLDWLNHEVEKSPKCRLRIEAEWIKNTLTKYVDAQLVIQRTEETINKLNKPPSHKECNSNRK